MRIRSVATTLLCTLLLGACAHSAPRADGDAIAANDTTSRESRDQVDRWAMRKQMCRELGVRFDRSGLCW